MTSIAIVQDANYGKTELAQYHEPQAHGEILPFEDRRKLFRMKLKSIEKLGAILTFPDDTAVYTVIFDLSAGGFSCRLNNPSHFNESGIVMVTISLHLDKTITFRAAARFGCITQTENQLVYRFKFGAEREEIHFYLLKKQIETIRKERYEKLD